MAGFDDPAACLPAGDAELEFDLFAAATDVCLELACVERLPDGGVVVAAVEAQPLRALPGRFRPYDRDRVEGCG